MRDLRVKTSYKRDLKRVIKQGWSGDAIDDVVLQLLQDNILDSKLKDHALSGDLKDFRECHVYSDLVIIYKRDDEILELYRIGRHQDLFSGY